MGPGGRRSRQGKGRAGRSGRPALPSCPYAGSPTEARMASTSLFRPVCISVSPPSSRGRGRRPSAPPTPHRGIGSFPARRNRCKPARKARAEPSETRAWSRRGRAKRGSQRRVRRRRSPWGFRAAYAGRPTEARIASTSLFRPVYTQFTSRNRRSSQRAPARATTEPGMNLCSASLLFRAPLEPVKGGDEGIAYNPAARGSTCPCRCPRHDAPAAAEARHAGRGSTARGLATTTAPQAPQRSWVAAMRVAPLGPARMAAPTVARQRGQHASSLIVRPGPRRPGGLIGGPANAPMGVGWTCRGPEPRARAQPFVAPKRRT